MKSSPKLARFLAVPARKLSPNPTSSSSDPTPQAIPNMVRKERSLCVHMARNTSPKLVTNLLITEATNIGRTKFQRARFTSVVLAAQQPAKGTNRVKQNVCSYGYRSDNKDHALAWVR